MDNPLPIADNMLQTVKEHRHNQMNQWLVHNPNEAIEGWKGAVKRPKLRAGTILWIRKLTEKDSLGLILRDWLVIRDNS